ncbi:MAG: PQQ-binding-like beta-propeller repeat protein [Pirellulaceae bacterium]|nr:hypothetical protein [Planctomycetaceae bacterium]
MTRQKTTFAIVYCCVFAGLLLQGSLRAADSVSTDWPRFRGPAGTGQGAGNLPTKWDENSITWAADLPVHGHSSPIVVGNRIFLTGWTQIDAGVERRVLCIDRKSSKVLWNQVVAVAKGERLHNMNSWATPSCATDGDLVVAFFGPGGLHCLTVDGEPKWSRELGDFPGGWGIGGSPILYGDAIIQNCDAQGDSFLIAVNKKTGKDMWRTPRRSKPRGGWSTPIVIDVNGHDELLLNGEFGLQAYDPNDGTPTWFCKAFNGRGTPAPAIGHGLVYVVNGKSGDVYAVKPGGKGDVTDDRMAWHTERKGGRDLPSPILVGSSLFVVNMAGIATCYDATTGDERWKVRLNGEYSGSPVSAGGLIYVCDENGIVSVVKAGEQFELIARNSVGAAKSEVFRSSPAVSQGQLFLRSTNRLFCIGKLTQ